MAGRDTDFRNDLGQNIFVVAVHHHPFLLLVISSRTMPAHPLTSSMQSFSSLSSFSVSLPHTHVLSLRDLFYIRTSHLNKIHTSPSTTKKGRLFFLKESAALALYSWIDAPILSGLSFIMMRNYSGVLWSLHDQRGLHPAWTDRETVAATRAVLSYC